MATSPLPSSSSAAREVEVEVLPRGSRGVSSAQEPWLGLLAKVMDSLFTVPGTKIKVGLDPIISLLPIVGSPASALVSLLLLVRAAYAGVPNAVLARMALNVLVNTALGEIPFAGDLVSVFFRSNAMNYELLQKHAGTKRSYTWKDRCVVIGLVLGAVLLVVSMVIGFFWLGIHLWRAVFG